MSALVAISDVVDVVCEHFQCSQADIRGARRIARLSTPRQIAMYLAYKLTQHSTPKIGKALGDRDHATIMYGRMRIEARLKTDAELAETVTALEIAATALGQMRGRGVIPAAVEPASPREIAERVVAGGRRAALHISPDHVLELASALLACNEREDEASSTAQLEPAVAVASPLSELIHDFLGLEASYRRAPCVSLRETRDRKIEEMRERKAQYAELDALFSTFDAFKKSEFTAAERDAQQRYLAAVRNLSKAYFKMIEETAANV